jgi:hypothetical protein
LQVAGRDRKVVEVMGVASNLSVASAKPKAIKGPIKITFPL